MRLFRVLFLFLLFDLYLFADMDKGLKIKFEKMKTEKRVALIIGNANYKKFAKLKNPINDAIAMKNILKKRGFKVFFLENATKREIKDSIKKFVNTLGNNGGVGFFYYSGHGIAVDGQNYLIPVNSDIEDEDDVEYEAISLDYLTKKLHRIRNRLNIIVLDACRNNPFNKGVGSGGLAPLTNARGMFVAYATEAGNVASDGSGSNGVFTKYLIENIIKPIPIEEVFKKTRKEVVEETNGKQFPGVYNQIMGDFYFTIPKIKNNQKITNNRENTQISRPDEEMWKIVKNSNSISDIRYFINSYPNSPYVFVAKLKLKKLTPSKNVRYKKTNNIIKDYEFFDSFKNNKNNWAVKYGDIVSTYIQDNYYYMEHKTKNTGWLSWMNLKKYNPSADFYVSTIAYHKSGVDNYGYGIVWGKDANNCYEFKISDNGQYTYGKFVNGKWKTLVNWTKSEYIQKNNSTNMISVKKVKNKISFLINGVVVDSKDFESFDGNIFGFVVEGTQSIGFQYFEFKEQSPNKNDFDLNHFVMKLEDFNNNKNNWSLKNKDNLYFHIDNGYYIMESYKNKGYWLSWMNTSIKNNQNFDLFLGVVLDSTSVPKKFDYGLMWGDNTTNSYEFGIYPSGYYVYGKYVDGKWKTLAYDKSSLIKTDNGVENFLNVTRVGKYIFLSINHTIVKRMLYEPFQGSHIGVYTNTPGKIKVDGVIYSLLF